LELLLPSRCLACGGIVAPGGSLCAACFSGMAFLAPPLCRCCGRPFELDPGEGTLCAVCIAMPPPYGRARAALDYDDTSRGLVLRFKHADATHAARPFARWMVRAGAELLAEAEVIVPVPLHRWRLLSRRYNQAALLAIEIGRESGVVCVPDALARIRATPSQGQMGRRGRSRNIKGAFRVARPETVAGKRIVLVDDVLTSGATVGECVRVLLKEKAARVDVLTLARVTLGE
jgi:ComF family protein